MTLEEFVIIRRTALVVPVALAALSLVACSKRRRLTHDDRLCRRRRPCRGQRHAEDGRRSHENARPQDRHTKADQTYTAEDDPNHLLGRPNGYSSKTTFGDSHVKADDVGYLKEDAVERGGSVEVHHDEAAKARKGLHPGSGKGPARSRRIRLRQGCVSVRASRFLTPDQASSTRRHWG
jgi:hypothetical protein